MKITILTLFPEMFDSYLSPSIIKRAIEEKSLSAAINDIEYIRYNIIKEFYEKYNSILNMEEKEYVKKEISRKENIVRHKK